MVRIGKLGYHTELNLNNILRTLKSQTKQSVGAKNSALYTATAMPLSIVSKANSESAGFCLISGMPTGYLTVLIM